MMNLAVQSLVNLSSIMACLPLPHLKIIQSVQLEGSTTQFDSCKKHKQSSLSYSHVQTINKQRSPSLQIDSPAQEKNGDRSFQHHDEIGSRNWSKQTFFINSFKQLVIRSKYPSCQFRENRNVFGDISSSSAQMGEFNDAHTNEYAN